MIPPVIGCVLCRGIGVVAAPDLRTCSKCEGRGYVVSWPPTERSTAVHRDPPPRSLLASLVDLVVRAVRGRK